MYTQCPDCRTAFRVVADDLRQAAGKVRCGDCGAAFDALLYLSEDPPESPSDAALEPMLPELKRESKVDRPNLPETISANESIALLQTLDELAGSDIRIEDTGIEWRVLDDVAMSEMATVKPADDEPVHDEPAQDTEVRYDDNSPIPDDLATDFDRLPDGDSAVSSVADEPATDPEPQRMVDDMDSAEIDDSGDWEAILDEFDDPGEDSASDDAGDDEAARAIEDASSEQDRDAPGGNNSDDRSPDDVSDDSTPEIDAAAEASEAETNRDEGDTPDEEPQTAEHSGDDSSPSQWQLLDEDEQDESIPTLSEPHDFSPDAEDGESLGAEDDLVADEDIGVESIVLEGDSVRIALDDMEAAASLRAATGESNFSAAYAAPPPPAHPAGRRTGLLVAILLLLALLGVQVVHQQRDRLARIPAVNDIIGPLYRMVGRPLTPAWDVTGWSFEATTGNADSDDANLNIYTRIGNRSDQALPYPLIGVSLTDRFEEIIGSRVVEPSGYLASGLNPGKLVEPGKSFEAFIAVESPDALASGYKLDVCYRLPDRRLRCAIGDFR